MSYAKCPRCGETKLECLETYAFCWECNYSPSTADHVPHDITAETRAFEAEMKKLGHKVPELLIGDEPYSIEQVSAEQVL